MSEIERLRAVAEAARAVLALPVAEAANYRAIDALRAALAELDAEAASAEPWTEADFDGGWETRTRDHFLCVGPSEKQWGRFSWHILARESSISREGEADTLEEAQAAAEVAAGVRAR